MSDRAKNDLCSTGRRVAQRSLARAHEAELGRATAARGTLTVGCWRCSSAVGQCEVHQKAKAAHSRSERAVGVNGQESQRECGEAWSGRRNRRATDAASKGTAVLADQHHG